MKCGAEIELTWRWVDSESFVNCTPRGFGYHEPDLTDRVQVEEWLAS